MLHLINLYIGAMPLCWAVTIAAEQSAGHEYPWYNHLAISFFWPIVSLAVAYYLFKYNS